MIGRGNPRASQKKSCLLWAAIVGSFNGQLFFWYVEQFKRQEKNLYEKKSALDLSLYLRSISKKLRYKTGLKN